MNKDIDWDETYITMIYTTAARSHDTRTNVGAVIVGEDKTLRSMGYNALPRGIEAKPERMVSPEKYKWFVHAEANAVFNAGRAGTSLVGCTIYVNLLPCSICATAILQSGITEVVVHTEGQEAYIESAEGEHNWEESFRITKEMFSEAGIKLRFVSYKLPVPKAFFNGTECKV